MKVRKNIFSLLVLSLSMIFVGCNTNKFDVAHETATGQETHIEYTDSEKAEIYALAEKYELNIVPTKACYNKKLKSISEIEEDFKQLNKQNNTVIPLKRVKDEVIPVNRIKTMSERPIISYKSETMYVSVTPKYKLYTKMLVTQQSDIHGDFVIEFPLDDTGVIEENLNEWWHVTFPAVRSFGVCNHEHNSGSFDYSYLIYTNGSSTNTSPPEPSMISTTTRVCFSIYGDDNGSVLVEQIDIEVSGL